jgi:nicotinamide mononucleotide (NMN) deamidase PncC
MISSNHAGRLSALPKRCAAAYQRWGILNVNADLSICAQQAAGGLISASILACPGASKVYVGGLTLYTLPSRIAYAGWTEENTKNYKGPTPDVVGGMAKNVLNTLKADYCVCESGTAGPTGGTTRNRTPGYCALAVAFSGKGRDRLSYA